MSSPRVAAAPRTGSKAPAIRPLLDAAFGFLVWAIHLLLVYSVSATACQTGLRDVNTGARTGFLIALGLVTVAAAAVVVVHAMSRYRRWREVPEARFRMWVTIGCDAVAAIAISWQLFAFLLVPLCR